MKNKTNKNVITIFFLTIFLVSNFSSIAKALEYGGFGGRPSYPRQDNPRTESIFIHTLEPGTNKKEGVTVINNTNDKKTFIIYGADSTPSSGGAFACEQISEKKEDVGLWINLSKKEVTLNPASNEIVPFTINVPKTASVGEHNGCILIMEKKAASKDQAGVSLSTRVGLRVAITIPGEMVRKLEILGFTIKFQNGIYTLQPRVKNTGNVSIDTDVKVVTSHWFGKSISVKGGQYPVLRGDISEWNFEIKKPFWGGLYRSKLLISYDADSKATVGLNTDAKMTALGKSAWFFSLPTFLGFILELAFVALVVYFKNKLKQNKKNQEWIKNNWVEYIVEPNESIQSLATKFNIPWKSLAKVNNLKPPYVLTSEDKIKVPPTK